MESTLKNTLIFLIITFFFTSCGTITRKDEYLAIDSSKRGLNVYNSEKNLLGTTPLIIDSPQKRKNIYYFGDLNHQEIHRCDISWNNSLMPAILISPWAIPTTLIVSSASLLTDYTFDNMFTCNKTLSTDLSPTGFQEAYQKKLLIIPIFEGSLEDIPAIISTIQKNIGNKIEIINYQNSLESFLSTGISETKKWDVHNIKNQNLLKVAKEFSATHIAIINKETNRVEIFDLFTKNKINTEIKLGFHKNLEAESSFFNHKKFIYLLPNSLEVGSTDSSMEMVDDALSPTSIEKNPNDFHWALGMWSLSNITSPNLYDVWDYNTKISPTIAFPSLKAKFEDRYFLINSYLATYDIGVVGHTPIGAININIGIGYVYVNVEDKNEKTHQEGSVISHFNINYYAFITEKFYFKAQFDYYSSDQGIKLDEFTSIKQINSTSVSLGYFYPEVIKYFK